MTHPDELLAEYVDGSLSSGDKAAVDEHLVGCARCRDEIALSRHAAASLRLLSDRPAPAGVASTALEAARTRERKVSTAARPPRWYRLAPVAAAAAVVLLLVIAIPRFTSSSTNPTAPEALSSGGQRATFGGSPTGAPIPTSGTATATTNGGTFQGPARGLERQSANYDSASLHTLAAPPPSFGPFEPAASFGSAKKCVTSAEHGQSGVLVRLIETRYQNTPSYVAVFLPNGLKKQGAGSPITIIVVTTSGCSLLAVGGGVG